MVKYCRFAVGIHFIASSYWISFLKLNLGLVGRRGVIWSDGNTTEIFICGLLASHLCRLFLFFLGALKRGAI